ncbi:UvrD-helicase domain-containing protein [Corynebacterium callunae]|uniref:UvrD-helicase domain-containing protein n=1 Tax=Corynebacterium callunae TaxID=1721 RepID=UPI003981ED55
MREYTPTAEQIDFVEASDEGLFVVAVPGAGKTETISRRFVHQCQRRGEKQGMPVLTFTNNATEEIQTRVDNQTGKKNGVHFIGTIDSFLITFLTRPFCEAEYGTTPSIHESWDDLGKVARIELASFISNSKAIVGLSEIDWNEPDPLQTIKRNGVLLGATRIQVQEIKDAMVARRRALVRQGFMTHDEAREIVEYVLKHNPYRIVDIISTRFREILVDEVQDCNSVDLALLRELNRRGVVISLIGDLDQDIYSFRGTNASKVRELATELKLREIRMVHNFRSTPSICGLVSELRASSNVVDIPTEINVDDIGVVVLPYKQREELSSQVTKLLSTPSISRLGVGSPVFLATGWEAAASAAGGEQATKVYRTESSHHFLSAISGIVSAHGDNRALIRSIERLTIALQDNFYIEKDEPLARPKLEEHLGSLGLSVREACLKLAFFVGDPTELVQDEFKRRIIEVCTKELGLFVRQQAKFAPSNADWQSVLNKIRPPKQGNFEFDTIFGSKGKQYESVVLVLDQPENRRVTQKSNEFIRSWSRGQSTEERRLYYVGASRAQKLLIIAVPPSLESDLVSQLSKTSVNASRWNEDLEILEKIRPVED